MEFFENIPKIKFEGKNSHNPYSFKFYNPDEVILGKSMREHLKFSMAYWHTMCGDGKDMFGNGTYVKDFSGKTPIDIYKNKAYAAFEILDKLSIDYFCFHDRDIAPEGETLSQTNQNLDIIVPIIKNLMSQYDKKLLWGTANLFANPRYMHGAGTSPYADVYAFAAAQIKKAIEITVELGGANYLFWGGREGYETLLNTNMSFELDNLARLMHMSVDYARSLGFKGDFYIEPKPKEPTKHQYDFDTSTVLAYMQKYDLKKDFRVNIEANHATLAGHTFAHELRVARDNDIFGSIDSNQGDPLIGWDTDQFPTNIYEAAFCMYEVIKAGGFAGGGLNFDAKTRRGSYKPDDIFLSHIAGMDSFAKGFKIANKIIEDGRLDDFVNSRYSSYENGIGEEIVSGKATLQSLEKYAIEMGEVGDIPSGKQEYLESLVNSIMFD